MNHTDEFPDDENGRVLRRMSEGGDDLTKPRTIDFCFAFESRRGGLDFAAIVQERDFEVCISYYDERKMWQVIVKHYMVPTHNGIGEVEATLSERAISVGGEPDGWGCMQVDRTN